jgi:hypothetical protein
MRSHPSPLCAVAQTNRDPAVCKDAIFLARQAHGPQALAYFGQILEHWGTSGSKGSPLLFPTTSSCLTGVQEIRKLPNSGRTAARAIEWLVATTPAAYKG